MLKEILEVMPLLDQFDCGLFANSWNTRNIISGITHKPLHIDDPCSLDAELRSYFWNTNTLAFHGIEHCDPVRHQLHQIFITRDDYHFSPLLFPASRQSCNNVISFVPFQFKDGNAIRTDEVFYAS